MGIVPCSTTTWSTRRSSRQPSAKSEDSVATRALPSRRTPDSRVLMVILTPFS